jgi:dolichol kinase
MNIYNKPVAFLLHHLMPIMILMMILLLLLLKIPDKRKTKIQETFGFFTTFYIKFIKLSENNKGVETNNLIFSSSSSICNMHDNNLLYLMMHNINLLY